MDGLFKLSFCLFTKTGIEVSCMHCVMLIFHFLSGNWEKKYLETRTEI